MADDTDDDGEPDPLLAAVVEWRRDEARKAGLTIIEARLFAESDTDVGVLRKLVAAHCPVEQIARILL